MRMQTVSRRKFLSISLTALAVCVATANAVTTSNSGRQLTLREQLIVGLRVAAKEDQEFVNRVVALVNAGALPRKLVDSTFLWARQQAAERGGTASVRPMIYFRPALTLRARRLGIRI